MEDMEQGDDYDDLMKEYAEAGNFHSCNIESNIPSVTLKEPCWMGIDEAGRGPVCGPMVYGTAFAPLSGGERLKKMGFADSKTLTEEQRDGLFQVIKGAPEFMGWIVSVLSPQDLSAGMLGRIQYNLNAISHDTAIALIKKVIAQGVNLKEVYVDTVGIDTVYQAKLEKIFPQLSITVAKKADSKYPICSAASICAKVTRDLVVSAWNFPETRKIDTEFGSGYPSDPRTKEWLAKSIDHVFGFPGLVRFSWSTAKKLWKIHAWM
eukprot:m.134302 g.134302  ORF g.134302 m.134302 type:complete len:264 (+) comp14691_c0_seq2:123-914(+)